MLGLSNARLIAKAVQYHNGKVDEYVPKKQSLLSRVAETLGVNPTLLAGGAVTMVVGAVGAAVYALMHAHKDSIDDMAETIEKDNDTKLATSPTSGPVSVSPAVLNASAPVQQPAVQATTDSQPLSLAPHKGASITGALTIQSEAHGNRKLITNTVATKRGIDTASYGAFQMTGTTLKDYIASSKYGAKLSGLKPGSSAFTNKWAELTNGIDGDAFIEDQKNYLVEKLLKPYVIKPLAAKGIKFDSLPPRTQEFLFSAAVNTPALAKKSVMTLGEGASSSDIVMAISKARADKYSANSIELKTGLYRRLVDEADYAGVKLSLNDFSGPVQVDLSKLLSPPVRLAQNAAPPVSLTTSPLPPQTIFKTKSGILAVS